MDTKGFSSGMYGWLVDRNEGSIDEILRECAASGLDALEIDPTVENIEKTLSLHMGVSGSYWGAPLHERWEMLQTDEV